MGASRRVDRRICIRGGGGRVAQVLLAATFSVATLITSSAPVAAASPHSTPTQLDGQTSQSRLIVVWRKPVVAGAAARIVGVRREERSPNSRRSLVVAEPGQMAAVAARLRADPAVASVVVDRLRHVSDFPATPPNDPGFVGGYQGDLIRMGVQTAWLTTIGSPTQVVAVIDSGMDRTHEDLDAVSVVYPWNAITGTTDVTDDVGHGTHVIGEIAAETNNGVGISGIAPGVTIMPIKACSPGGCWNSDIDNGIDWARMHGATVINMSLGGSGASSTEQTIIANAYNAGITVVASAGNSGDGTISYPAAYADVISVAATDNSDAHASFSTYNAAVDLSAPGVGIWSTVPGGYDAFDGTSMSSPHVAAVAAMVRSVHPTFTPAQVEFTLEATAVDLGAAGRDDVFGFGRVDAAAAVVYGDVTPPPPPPPPVVPTEFTINQGQSITLEQTGAPGAWFALESSPDLTTWSTVLTRTIGVDGYVDFTFAPPRTAYYRTTFADSSSYPFIGVVIPDTTRPTVSRKTPTAGRTGVDRDSNIKITFSEKVLHLSRTTVRLVNNATGSTLRLRSFSYNASTHVLTLDPYFRLTAMKTYRVRVASTITDAYGNHIAATTWTFKTGWH